MNKIINDIDKTRNVSIGYGCPHFSTFLTKLKKIWADDRWMDKGIVFPYR